jgi:hypothetical protein
MSDLDPDRAEARFPGRRRQLKKRGHLTDTGVYYGLHFDGHEKLNFKALRMGPVGIDIYGSRYYSSSRMVKRYCSARPIKRALMSRVKDYLNTYEASDELRTSVS